MNKEKQEYINALNAAPEEVRQAIQREDWREAQREYRKKKCRNAKGIVCRKDCKSCPYYLRGEGLTGDTLSLNAFTTEDGVPIEFADERVDVELEVARSILRAAVRRAQQQLDDRERLILTYFLEERSDTEIAAALHITKSGAREAWYRLFAKLKVLLSDFSNYFQN